MNYDLCKKMLDECIMLDIITECDFGIVPKENFAFKINVTSVLNSSPTIFTEIIHSWDRLVVKDSGIICFEKNNNEVISGAAYDWNHVLSFEIEVTE